MLPGGTEPGAGPGCVTDGGNIGGGAAGANVGGAGVGATGGGAVGIALAGGPEACPSIGASDESPPGGGAEPASGPRSSTGGVDPLPSGWVIASVCAIAWPSDGAAVESVDGGGGSLCAAITAATTPSGTLNFIVSTDSSAFAGGRPDSCAGGTVGTVSGFGFGRASIASVRSNG